jgi:perosamine synthetase
VKEKDFIHSVIDAIKAVLPETGRVVGLHEPCFSGKEQVYLKECIDSTWVSYLGKFVEQFEGALAEFTGAKKAVALVNGTAALHIALKLVGVEPGDEVLVPALTFVATANAVAYCGGIPHFVDSEAKTLGMDPEKLASYLSGNAERRDQRCFNKRTGRWVRAIVPMHAFGHPVDLDPLADLCNTWGIEMVEDAAESLGSFYKGKHTGNWGKCSVLSFNGNKIVTTGGGGAVLTNDEALADRIRHLTSTAKIPHRWEYKHDALGYNYRLPNINAALGCAQMEELPTFLERKRVLASRYEAALDKVEGIAFFKEPEFARSNYWLNVLLLDEARAEQRDRLLEAAHDHNVMMRPVWTLMHKLPMYNDCPRMDLTIAEGLERRIVNIPSSPSLAVDRREVSQEMPR